MSRGIVVLAQNVYNQDRLLPKLGLEQEFKNISVDIWYKALPHTIGQHIWHDQTVYIVTKPLIPMEEFALDKVKLLVPNVKIHSDTNPLIVHHRGYKNDIVLSNNLIYRVTEDDTTNYYDLIQEYIGVHVDIWYEELRHVKGQHVWINDTVYKLKRNISKDTPFKSTFGTKLVDTDIKLYKDENTSLLFENPLPGDLVLSNNALFTVGKSITHNYVDQACALAMSVHNTNPTEKISIVTNDVVPVDYVSLFDNIIPIPFGDAASASDWKIENRWKLYYASPYDETIVMDTDMLVLQNIETWWSFLSNYELFFTNKVMNYRGDIANTDYYRQTFIDSNLPNLFSGLHYFKQCEFAKEFYTWLELVIVNWEDFYNQHLESNSRPTQVSIDVCAAIVAKILDCESSITNNISKIPSFTHMKPYCQDWQEVQSSWQDKVGVYISKDGSIKIGNYIQTGILHYTENNFIKNSPTIERYRNLTNV
jgi:hypothetical protein